MWFCLLVSLLIIVLISWGCSWLVFCFDLLLIFSLFFLLVSFLFIGGVKCEFILIFSSMCEFLFCRVCFRILFGKFLVFLFCVFRLLGLFVFGFDCCFGWIFNFKGNFWLIVIWLKIGIKDNV